MKKVLILLLLCGLLSIACGNRNPEIKNDPITTGSLFEEMIDLKGLLEYPDPSYRTIQFSSYDHRSRLPGGPGWFLNSDGFGKEPEPNFEEVLKQPGDDGIGEYLVCDVKGPGGLVRLWTAAINGSIKMYLDNQAEPLYNGPADEFFQHVYDVFFAEQNLDSSVLEGSVYQRDSCYAPIPFAKNLRIIWIGDLQKVHFYQAQVKLYPHGTEIVTFTPQDLVTYKDTIDNVVKVLRDPDKNWEPSSDGSFLPFELNLEPSGSEQILLLEEPGVLENLVIGINAVDRDLALRQTVMHIICDDYPWGQVQSPVGDFFGAAPGVNPYQSLPFTVHPDGTMTSRWPMPFKKAIKIRIDNHGEQAVIIKGSAHFSPYEWKDSRSMHFRARWRVNHGLVASNKEVQDLPFLLAHGQGVYVGTTSLLLNPSPGGKWWGEGDEKVFVDNDELPSLFGTGTEDYYNYSYSAFDLFSFPYCGQPRNDGPDNRGFVTNFRWHVLDALPFENMIRFYMELYHADHTPGFSYARVAYHYAAPGVTDDHIPITQEDVRPPLLPETFVPESRRTSLGAKFYEAEEIINSRSRTRAASSRLWSRGKLLFWEPAKNGAEKYFPFEIEKAGLYRIYLAVARTPDSGRISVALDDKKVQPRGEEEIIDLRSPYHMQLRKLRLQDTRLEPGKHKLSVVYLGTDQPDITPEVGFDFIEVQLREY